MKLWSLLLACALNISVAQAQINVVSVNGGTGGLVSIPIPGGSGLSVTVGTGSAALPLQDIKNNANAVNITTGDDSFTNVPLGFDFPFYGLSFNNSWAMTNGLVTFQNPNSSGLGGACCSGVNLTTTTDSRYNYTIYGLHTDLYSWNGQNQYYLREGNSMTYGWYNVSQCCSSQGGNSFEIKIDSTGLVDTRIAGTSINYSLVTSGMAGDLSKGEYYQAYHGNDLNIAAGSVNIFSWQALGGTGAVDACVINPLSSPTCSGYQAAYTAQQCTISALYDPSCPGYAAAYHNQQCSINALYSTTCFGYAEAYKAQQCALDGLYDKTCPNYATAYATKMLLEQQGMASTVATAGTIAQNDAPSTTTASTSVGSDGSVSVDVSKTGDTNVDKAISSPAPTTNSAAAPSAPVQLVAPGPAPAAPAPSAKNESGPTQSARTGDTKPAANPRQELQARRESAAKAQAAEKGKNLANEMGKAADMESQKQIQNLVIEAMGFTPGFDSYGKAVLSDAAGYKPYTVYGGQRVIENRNTSRMFGGTDRLHQEMINQQYK